MWLAVLMRPRPLRKEILNGNYPLGLIMGLAEENQFD